MNDLDGPSPDWAEILPRAHRRIYVRVVAVAAITAAATLLLTSASVVNRAAVVRGEHRGPDLVILASVRGVPGERGQFFVKNDSSTKAQRFAVVVTASKGKPRPYRFSGLAANRRTRWKRFACRAGDRVTLKIRSRQIEEPDSTSRVCPEGRGGSGGSGGSTSTTPRHHRETREKDHPDGEPSCDDPKSFDSIKEYEEECPPDATGSKGGGEGGGTSTGESSEKG